MRQVVLDISMSLDGFVTAPNDERGRGLGDGGEVLHYWVFGGRWTYNNVPDAKATGVDQRVLDEAMQGGAGVAGRGGGRPRTERAARRHGRRTARLQALATLRETCGVLEQQGRSGSRASVGSPSPASA
jgi:hypothetical protein